MADVAYEPLPFSSLEAGAPVDATTAEATVALLAPLDGVRGCAALLIVCGHILTFFAPHYTPSAPFRFPAVGVEYLSAVSLFFVLSGFTLTRVAGPSPAWAGYAQRRVARLAPAYYAGLLLGLLPLLVYVRGPALGLSLVAAPLALQAFVPIPGSNTWDGPLWTVGALAACAALLPPLLRSLRGRSAGALFCVLASCQLLQTASLVVCVALGQVDLLHRWAVLRVPQFVVGVAAAVQSQQRPRPLRWPVVTVEACVLLLLADQLLAAHVSTRFGPLLWFLYQFVSEFSMCPLFACFLVALTDPGAASSPSRRLLATRQLRFLGNCSYSLYCSHFPVLQIAAFAAAGRVSATAVPWHATVGVGGFYCFSVGATLPLLGLCVLVAAVVHRFVETPGRAAINAQARTLPATGTAVGPSSAAPSTGRGAGVVHAVQPANDAELQPAELP